LTARYNITEPVTTAKILLKAPAFLRGCDLSLNFFITLVFGLPFKVPRIALSAEILVFVNLLPNHSSGWDCCYLIEHTGKQASLCIHTMNRLKAKGIASIHTVNVSKEKANVPQATANVYQAKTNLTQAKANVTQAKINLTQAKTNLTQAKAIMPIHTVNMCIQTIIA